MPFDLSAALNDPKVLAKAEDLRPPRPYPGDGDVPADWPKDDTWTPDTFALAWAVREVYPKVDPETFDGNDVDAIVGDAASLSQTSQ